ncbi:hypothetical protein O6H91_07G009000 [Diphasiastrum complanatum]|uniref:Uncharacterized protein n=1 Tax=Diphasiastrum complanatum TaxID=34168 RepID=A0ACC2D2F5_DIPCM|nr:hypothetical protein O6H91_07G009000 [Diphasiastrum complanatum]
MHNLLSLQALSQHPPPTCLSSALLLRLRWPPTCPPILPLRHSHSTSSTHVRLSNSSCSDLPSSLERSRRSRLTLTLKTKASMQAKEGNPSGTPVLQVASIEIPRRQMLRSSLGLSIWIFGMLSAEKSASAWFPANIDLTKVPSQPFDAADQRLRDAASIFEQALLTKQVEEEEKLWTKVINKYDKLDAVWVSDIISRAYGNRGNARSRQGKMEEALKDYDLSIALAPYAVDPVLNRGVALESLGRYVEAMADYEAVLCTDPKDPAAWNNLGNAKAALQQWDEALADYGRAVQLAPEYAFAAANYALALYQVGRENEAVRHFQSLLRKYPEFPDVRAALAVSLYAQGLTAEAENNWYRIEDGRHKDRNWIKNTRKWPPKLVYALESFLDVNSN